MDLNTFETNHAIKEILDQITQDLPGYRWERICAFTDGKDKTVLELSLYRQDGQELAASFAYQVETGEILHYRNSTRTLPTPDALIDLLLDIRNQEYQRFSRS